VLVAGDKGEGKGTRGIFSYLLSKMSELSPDYLVVHYCLPIVSLARLLCESIDASKRDIFLIADAGGMYAAKAAKRASCFDIFTPDPSEMAFLADPEATHPAQISKHLFTQGSENVPEQVMVAYKNNDAAKLLIVKGATDYIAENGRIVYKLDRPNVPALEPIGGTGDTVTGLVSALVYAGYKPLDAAIIAVKTNRTAGQYVNPTPATPVKEIINAFPAVLNKYIIKWSKYPLSRGR
jgi:NAD(P)H-hydrate repair Nnr-like enzyme with NAD(P)H-hydrate dehydratase domain